jgi:DNA-directed RNA polymerase specialized sigma24 family protein
MEWTTTSTLLRDLRDWEKEEAWQRFAGRFRDPIMRFAGKLGVRDTDAEDVAQETLLAFARRYREGAYDRTKGALSRWLFGFAYREVLRHRRESARADQPAPPVGPAAEQFWAQIPDEAAASTLWEHEWSAFVLGACIERVRDEFEPQTMRIFEHLARHDDAAAAASDLGVPIKAVYNAKHRVLSRIRAIRSEIEETEDA